VSVVDLDGLMVVHSGLEETAVVLSEVVNAIDVRLDALERDLAPLATSWVGEAQQAYAVAKRRWDASIAEMRDLLQQTSVQVSRSNDDYRAADARGARAFDL